MLITQILGIGVKGATGDFLGTNLLEALLLRDLQETSVNQAQLSVYAKKAYDKLPGSQEVLREQFDQTGKIVVPQPRLSLDKDFILSDLSSFTRTLSACHDKRNLIQPTVTGLTDGPISLPYGYASADAVAE